MVQMIKFISLTSCSLINFISYFLTQNKKEKNKKIKGFDVSQNWKEMSRNSRKMSLNWKKMSRNSKEMSRIQNSVKVLIQLRDPIFVFWDKKCPESEPRIIEVRLG